MQSWSNYLYTPVLREYISFLKKDNLKKVSYLNCKPQSLTCIFYRKNINSHSILSGYESNPDFVINIYSKTAKAAYQLKKTTLTQSALRVPH